jgi:GT2 family glycosyltransferase
MERLRDVRPRFMESPNAKLFPPCPTVSVVLGSYNRLPFLKRTLESIRRELEGMPSGEIIVVDGGSADGTLRWLVGQKDVITIVQHNRGTWHAKPLENRSWGYFMNLGFKCAQGKFILMVSDDCLLVPGSVKNGVTHFESLLSEDRKIGAVAFYWRNWPEQKDYWVGLTLGDKTFVNHGLFLRTAVEEVNWIDEERYHFYHADGDLCLKLWHAGYEVVDCPDAFVEHYSHANLAVRTSNLDRQKQDWQAYLARWTGIFYDPGKENLSDWKYQSYSDPFNTAALFPSRYAPDLRIGPTLRRILSTIHSKVVTGA